MSDKEESARQGIEGVIEDAKGKAKEVAGVITGDEDLKGEGRAQQDKAEAQREVATKEAAAEKARAEAEVAKARESGYQDK
ncbi:MULTISPECIES: microaggregate-binding protein 1 [Nocardia]|uniref:CsbD family protein n=2 Tax=Nocardia TaxID=1817 RepID=A0A516NMI7_9NOCA|nr:MULTISPECIES: CsbD family protein [Nocardia]MBF6180891.1 CsbD family protein [Nocardia otitidiscaviarum]MCP9625002.1 CsbD family protein [Nocardia otitidiscaviarum]QDP80107.1 CsbD family protein [Nocardia otitidiscaviarum]